jgi:ADP-dependent NAD(P)H-hydrate dehydratase / NAD(P)H-hydrate epimerase
MIGAFWVADVRAAEQIRLAQVPDGALMQRAAAGLAATCLRLLRERRGRVAGSAVLMLVGAGNNGGDALWAGARLAARGVRVTAALLAGQVHAEGLAALRAAGGRVIALESVHDHAIVHDHGGVELVLDGIVGLGGSPGLREPAASVVAQLGIGSTSSRDRDGDPGGGRRPVVVAVDLPSGVAPDSGETPAPHVVADVTVTFGAAKPCLLLPPASRAAGRVVEVDLGLGPLLPARAAVERLRGADLAAAWPVPGPDDDKYRRGVVGVVAGSPAYTGAAVLVCAGALRAGTGMVRYTGPGPAAEQVRAHWPEVVIGSGRVQAWALGSGVDPGAGDGQAEAIADALGSGLPCVVDAGALELLGQRPDLRDRLGPHALLTPHAGELARLLGGVDRADVEARPLHHARMAAGTTGATVLLKGSTTLVVTPDGRARAQADAPGWLATAGAGDVLAGMAAALLAAGLSPLDAGSVAAAVHGRAAQAARPGGPITARDVADAVPGVVARLVARSGGRSGR